MLSESQFCGIRILDMSNSDGNEAGLGNSTIPGSIPPIGSPILGSVSNSPKLENQGSVSCSTEEGEKRRCSGDGNDDGLENSAKPGLILPIGCLISESVSETPKLENQGSVFRSTEEEMNRRRRLGDEELGIQAVPSSILPIGSPISESVSKTPNLENQASVSGSTEEELNKRRRLGLGDETDQKDEEMEIRPIPSSIPPIGSPIPDSVSKTPKSENQAYVSLSTTKRRRSGDEIDENNDGFTTPTGSDHMIPFPAKCPPAPRKSSSRKGKPPPETTTENRRSIFTIDVSDEDVELMFPTRVDDDDVAR